MWAYRRVRTFAAFGVAPSASSSTLTSEVGSLAEQMVNVQQQILQCDHLVHVRSETLRDLERRVEKMHPPIFPGEEKFVLDTEPYDVSLVRLEESTSVVDGLIALRKSQQGELLAELGRIWVRLEVSEDKQRAWTDQVKSLDNGDFKRIFDEIATRRAALEPFMLDVQGRLRTVWEKMRLPEEVQAPYKWSAGQPLTESLLLKCEEEAATLEEVLERLQPLLGAMGAKELGMVVALLHGTLKRSTAEDRASEDGSLRTAAERVAQERAQVAAEIEALREQARAEQAAKAELAQREVQLTERTALLEAQLASAATEHEEKVKSLETNTKLMSALRGYEKARVQTRLEELESEANAAPQLLKASTGLKRGFKYEKLAEQREAQIKAARACLEVLAAPDAVLDDFEARHSTSWVDEGDATEEDMTYLAGRIADLEPVLERLESRCESDGLCIAIRHKCKDNGWSTKDVGRQVMIVRVKGQQKSMDNTFSLEQLESWLDGIGVTYTDGGLGFLVHMAGSSIDQAEAGKRLNVMRFVYGLERVVATPITL